MRLKGKAAIITTRASALDSTDEDWERMLEVNLTAVFRVCTQALPEL